MFGVDHSIGFTVDNSVMFRKTMAFPDYDHEANILEELKAESCITFH